MVCALVWPPLTPDQTLTLVGGETTGQFLSWFCWTCKNAVLVTSLGLSGWPTCLDRWWWGNQSVVLLRSWRKVSLSYDVIPLHQITFMETQWQHSFSAQHFKSSLQICLTFYGNSLNDAFVIEPCVTSSLRLSSRHSTKGCTSRVKSTCISSFPAVPSGRWLN